jgi:hypothetical protein
MAFDPNIQSGKYPSGKPWWGFDLALPNKRRHRKRFELQREAEVHRLWLLKTYGDGGGMSAAELLDCQEAVYLLRQAGIKAAMTEVANHFLKTRRVPAAKDIAAYAKIYQERKAAKGKRPKTLSEIAAYLNAFTQLFGTQEPADVSWEALDRYLADNSSRWHREKALRPFFDWMAGKSRSLAVLQDFPLERSPFIHIERTVPATKLGTVILYIAEVKALIQAAIGTDQLAWVIWGLFSGCRPESEARSMWAAPEEGWRQIDLAMRTATITSLKLRGGKTRQLILQPNLVKWLQYFQKEEIAPKHSRRHYRALRVQAIPGKAQVKDILRHTTISNLVKLRGPKGAPVYSLSDVAAQMGTSVKMIEKHYLAQISDLGAVKEFWSLTPASFGL